MLPAAHPDVIYKPLSGSAILYHAGQEVYFGLNTVGARIWELLPSCDSLQQLCAALGQEYPDVDAACLEADVATLLDQLAASGLLVAGSTESADDHHVATPAA